MANPEHLAILQQGVEAWNKWREANPGGRTDLSGGDLRDARLDGVNLTGAKLIGVKLDRATLRGANFRGADLTGAILEEAKLNHANFNRAFLSDANLRRADLPDVSFDGADLKRADLREANLNGADLSRADLRRANLSGADLSHAYLGKAKLKEANLYKANLRRAELWDANLERAHLEEANLTGANLRGANLRGIMLRGADLRGAKLDYASLRSDIRNGAYFPQEMADTEDSVRSAFDKTETRTPSIAGVVTSDRTIYAHAEMDEQVIINRVTTIEVLVSRERLNRIASAASQSGKIDIDPEKSLIVQVIPKTNFITIDGDRMEVNPPEEGKPHHLCFDLRATHLGEGEVWVVLRQCQVSLLTLTLRPQIVENRAATQKAMAQSPSSASFQSASGIVDEDDLPSQPQRLHQLRIIERRNGNQITYLYELSSPSLGLLSLHESQPIQSDRLEYVENLYREIESRWLGTQGDREEFAEELRAFGGQLFDQLFPEQLQRQLWEHREQIDSIMVLSTEPFIPWELVHLKPPGQSYLPDETCFFGQMGLVRWLHDVGFPSDEMVIRSGYAYYVIPNYPHPQYKLPQAEQEAEFLKQYLGAIRIIPQPNRVRLTLKSGDFDLLHFAGHGVADQDNIANAKLLMEGRIENGNYISAELGATTVEQYCRCNERDRNHRPMVVLNACQIGRKGYSLTGIGGFAQAFLKGGVGVFVGPLWSVGDRPARIFTETLYSSLIAGMTLSESTKAAREAAKEAGDSTWLAYAVYGHPHLRLRIW